MSDLTLEALAERIHVLEAEAAIRKLQAEYMMICDTPCPVYPPIDDQERIDRLMELYTDDAVWEGVGEYYTGQFGRAEGKEAVRAHFNRFWGEKSDPELLLNVHYLTTEQIHVDGDTATGHWVHMQPWIFSDGKSLLRSSRLNNAFRLVDGEWKISRTRTENVLVTDLPTNFAESFPTTSVLFKD